MVVGCGSRFFRTSLYPRDAFIARQLTLHGRFSLEIRKITLSDSEQLLKLIANIEGSLEDKTYWLPVDDESKEHFFDDSWTEFYGMFDDNQVLVAAAALFYNKHEYGESLSHLEKKYDKVAEIGRCMVNPSYRGHNYLRQINNELASAAKEKGIEYLLATVHPDNKPSQKSFMGSGFEKQAAYVKNGNYPRDILIKNTCEQVS